MLFEPYISIKRKEDYFLVYIFTDEKNYPQWMNLISEIEDNHCECKDLNCDCACPCICECPNFDFEIQNINPTAA